MNEEWIYNECLYSNGDVTHGQNVDERAAGAFVRM